jgi:hypothetical protein
MTSRWPQSACLSSRRPRTSRFLWKVFKNVLVKFWRQFVRLGPPEGQTIRIRILPGSEKVGNSKQGFLCEFKLFCIGSEYHWKENEG